MAVFESIFILLLLVPFALSLVLAVFLISSLGKSLGLRKRYVQCLLFIFEYGRERIERAQKKQAKYSEEEDFDTGPVYIDSDDEDELGEDANGNRSQEKSTCASEKQTPLNGLTESQSQLLTPSSQDSNGLKKEKTFDLADTFQFIKCGIEAIVEDQVTQRFVAEELKSWNMLTRTNRHYEFVSWRLSFIWVVGFFVRYFLMLPFRVTICFLGVLCLIMSTALVGLIPKYYKNLRKKLYNFAALQSFGVLSWSICAIIEYHDLENRPGGRVLSEDNSIRKGGEGGGGICVANHTSPIDVLVLAVDKSYAMIGQNHGGFLGVLQRALARASSHIWFERSEMKDREAVTRRLKEHVEDSSKLPILIFPEGTCINNSAVMQFKKGSFEVGGIIYPVAIKYDPRFGDPFWDSSQYSMLQYLYMMMTSWAIVCDVWYLPAMTRKPDETAVDFANRVKSEIAKKGGLVDLDWDGQLKRAPAKREWKEKQQLEYSRKFSASTN